MIHPVVDSEKCIGCGNCATTCSQNVFTSGKIINVSFPENCIGCGDCEADCIQGAITLEDEND